MPPRTLEQEEEALLRSGERKARRFWEGFIEMAMKGNILEVALGMIFASMFTALVTSLVSNILLPPLSVLLPVNKNLEEKFAILKAGPHYDAEAGYNTLKFAMEDGAVVLAYGMFLSKIVHFFAVGFALYTLAMMYQWLTGEELVENTKNCRYCDKKIGEDVIRCVHCSSWQDGREERMYGL